MLVITSELQLKKSGGQLIHYTANYVREGEEIAMGKRITFDAEAHPMVVMRGLHKWLEAIESDIQFHELCLKNTGYGGH